MPISPRSTIEPESSPEPFLNTTTCGTPGGDPTGLFLLHLNWLDDYYTEGCPRQHNTSEDGVEVTLRLLQDALLDVACRVAVSMASLDPDHEATSGSSSNPICFIPSRWENDPKYPHQHQGMASAKRPHQESLPGAADERLAQHLPEHRPSQRPGQSRGIPHGTALGIIINTLTPPLSSPFPIPPSPRHP